ncbi:MAG: transporter substrate-binding domain-containing protein [Mageeibacillus sp.]|jgi:signal transduction histidine kinase/ActR/RegA family two-component response regulator|nr:transporter substrate-binding domain-containing protein [Mageeibacillus sp.]MCI1263681.1 transporter substrate-binding domain-containing protein [Saccharofermentans sp.]
MKSSFKFRLLASFITVTCLFVSLSPTVCASNGNDKVIKVGFFAFDGYHMVDDQGNRSGYGYDFLQMLSRYGDWTYEYVGYDKSWAQMQDMLADGEIDLLTSAQKTTEREQLFAYSDKAIGTSAAILTVKSGDDRYSAGDYASYNGMRVGLLKDSSRNDKFEEFAGQKGFTYVPVYYDTVEEMEDDLQSGDNIDAIMSSNLRQLDNELVLDEFDPSDFYCMVRKDDTEFLEQINDAISQMDINMSDWRHTLWDKYYSDSNAGIALTADEKAYIRELEESGTVLNALVEPDNEPYSYFEKGVAKGIIPEIYAKIEEMTGLKFNIVEVKSRQEYDSVLSSDSSISVCLDAYSDYNRAEHLGYKLTSTYLSASLSAVSLRSTKEPFHSIAAVTSDNPAAYIIDELTADITVMHYDTIAECLDAVRDGDADVTYVLNYTAQQYMNNNDITGVLKSTLLPQYSIDYAIAVSNGSDCRLISILDKAVNNIGGESIEEVILSQTEGIGRSMTFRELVLANPMILVVAVVAAALIILLSAYVVFRQKNIKVIEAKNTELQSALMRADKASEAKSNFLSNMSHDMRTPLNGVISFNNFALQAGSIEKKQEYIEKSSKSAEMLMNLINDTLEVSRIENGKMELHNDWIGVNDLLSGIVMIIESQAADKKIAFSWESNFEDFDYAYVDKLKMQDVVLNLLTNAVRFTPEGGNVRLTAVRQRSEMNQDCWYIRITVKDTGIGISEKFLPYIYEPFSQENEQKTDNSDGSGLGLYIVNRIVSLMDGTIDIKSDKGIGTEASVVIPLTLEKRYIVEGASIEDSYDFSGKKVLLIEDNRINTEITRTILTGKGFEVICAEDGKKGTQLFELSEEGEYSAILMDIHMPEMDGYEATRFIRQLRRNDAVTVPIIAMTADAYEEDVERCIAAGMNGHTAKPVDAGKLLELLDSLINRKDDGKAT